MRTLAMTCVTVLTCLTGVGAMDLSQIQATLLAQPPNDGDPVVRRETILALDAILKSDTASTSTAVKGFLISMLQKVMNELPDPVPAGGARVWQMYNDGYLVKTSSMVFAFDLSAVSWGVVYPPSLASQIDVLLVSHMHADHYDGTTVSRVIAAGGEVIVPVENDSVGTIAMVPGDTLTVRGLDVVAYEGLHSIPVRIFEVTTPDGHTFVHTGDNQTPENLPTIDSVDVLMLNAWVKVSSSASPVDGMTSAIRTLVPRVTIPGHVHEMTHVYDPDNPASRVPYEWPLAVDTTAIPGSMCTMAWGELYELDVPLGTVAQHHGDSRTGRAAAYRVRALDCDNGAGLTLQGRAVPVHAEAARGVVRVSR